MTALVPIIAVSSYAPSEEQQKARAAGDGRLPYGMGVARLSDLPAEWSRQHQVLGLPGQ